MIDSTMNEVKRKQNHVTGLKIKIDSIIAQVTASGIQGRLLYSDNIPLVKAKLRDGICWKDTQIPLLPAAVSSTMYADLQALVYVYKRGELSADALNSLYPGYIEVMPTYFGDVLRIVNFYVVATTVPERKKDENRYARYPRH